jgi:hypothetical protein
LRRPKFAIDPTQLDKSAAAAFRAHTNGQLTYDDWKATAAQIAKLRTIESFRNEHGAALYDKAHPDHAKRSTELQALYERAYPDEPTAT